MKKLVKSFEYAKGVGVFMMVSLLVAACSQLDVEPNQPDDNLRVLALEAISGGPIVDPVYFDGNVLCSEAATEFAVEGGFEFTSPDPEGTGGNDYQGNNTFQESWPEGFTITVTDNKFVAWSFEPIYIDGVKHCLKDLVVIVKGGPGANAYYYGEGETGDSGLQSPNMGDNTPDLSNLKLCYNLEPCPDDEPCFEFEGETAWSAGSRYVARGNWATYTAYDDAAKTVTLFAGQTLEAGTVSFSSPVAGIVSITIELNEGWDFAEDAENVKIQDYADAPSGNPSPGGFAHKGEGTGSTFTLNVPQNNFYGVHVDVGQWVEVECEVEEVLVE